MLKNNQGVTIIALAITIIVLMIFAGMSITTGYSVLTDMRAGRIISNMNMIQAKVETISEQNEFDETELVGTRIGTYDQISNLSLENEEIELLENEYSSFRTLVWYKWDQSTLESQGLDKNMLENNHYFYVNYDTAEIIYSAGTSYNYTNFYFSLTGLTYAYQNN